MANYVEQNTTYFSKSAKNYDLATKIISPLRDKLFRAADVKTSDKVLDVATGTGAVALKFAAHGCTVTGVDLSKDMLAVALSKKKNLPVEFVQADASDLRFESKKFDAATVSFALHDMPVEVRKKVLQEVNRVLKDDGKFVIMDYAVPENSVWRAIALGIINSYEELHFKEFIQSDLKNLLQKSGFDISKHEKLLGSAVQLLVCKKQSR